MVAGRSCPRIFRTIRDGLAEQPDSRDRLRLLLRTTARDTTAALTAEEGFSNAVSRSSTAGSSSTPPAFHERPALVEALLLQDEHLRRRLSGVDQEALAARQAVRRSASNGSSKRKARENQFIRTTMSSAEALLGVLHRSADGGVEGRAELDVLRHAFPFGRRSAETPHPCDQTVELTACALELVFCGRKLNREAVRGCPERK
ncbi:hypothetical protein [Streptomyces sp. NL15-2K]|uniref:hypothetical protein n=1 Tax=Streptomyces sp. NL15-2K TaxID=376149 RepID=UPI00155AF192|nr:MULTISPECIES: hypothetical protein [Actinomycetes]WKX06586.1 hypothetical protein Q4V64_03375 [Kutzneria buriramensis]